jgi:uncharacterized membrane protein YgdD (TMEM256/DUF423 family)
MRTRIALGALLAGVSVILGAFGAHSLKTILPPEKLAGFQTAVHYQMIHSLAILLTGVLSMQLGEPENRKLLLPANCFLVGIALFSGSIYILTLGGPKLFGPITPLGGLAFMTGWFSLAYTFFKKNN